MNHKTALNEALSEIKLLQWQLEECNKINNFHKDSKENFAKEMVLKYARWFEDQGPPEFKQDDWMVKQNVDSFYAGQIQS